MTGRKKILKIRRQLSSQKFVVKSADAIQNGAAVSLVADSEQAAPHQRLPHEGAQSSMSREDQSGFDCAPHATGISYLLPTLA